MWKIHIRIRFYLGLTVIAIIVNLAIAAGGLVFIISGPDSKSVLIMLMTYWMRYVHIALDTLVLYSALGTSSFAALESTKQGRRNISSREGLSTSSNRSSGRSSLGGNSESSSSLSRPGSYSLLGRPSVRPSMPIRRDDGSCDRRSESGSGIMVG